MNRLNPSIEPYYRGLNVPTSARKWPKLPEGVPRRVSVNSFGFGGANAHAILESYQSSTDSVESLDHRSASFTPYTFSAASEASLVALLQAYSEHLKTRADTNPSDLAWTLQSCRTALPIKATFSAITIERLALKIDGKLSAVKQIASTNIGVRSTPAAPRILGVFTGQGAQWATMGGYLIRSSAIARKQMEHLENSLATLPSSDRPKWHLGDEISASAETSRISEAELSQPLCTAIQVILVDLLRSAGISFEAVVGHSSGEIAAAYAADFISAYDAIRIAYYRGLHARLAGEPNGQKGAMLAVGTSWEDAQDLIELPAFKGRLTIAAHNSSASVTLSGNADAINHAKKVFDEEKKFARMLKVDTAYHSHHMLPCRDPYIQSIRACKIRINRARDTSCSWYSSVTPGKAMEPIEELQDVYWSDNMTNAVLFTDAIKNAVSDKLNLALEVGPHPALKGPATQNISDARSALPYSGVLSRGDNDIEAFSDALGFVWTHLGADSVDFQAYEKLTSVGAPPKPVIGLPSYQWNHGRVHWHESRKSRKIRARADAFHELLGAPSPDATDRDRRWTNLLKASEIPWLNGHQLQGQTVFPAAGYVAMALEAAKNLAGDRPVMLLEIQDLVIGKAIAFEDDANFAAETLVTLTAISPARQDDKIQTADFSCYSCPNTGSSDMEQVASGKVKILFGTPSFTTLSSIPLETSSMAAIEADSFYSSALELGYNYTGPFRGMSSLKRRLDQACALVSTYSYADDEATLLVHPTMLDVAFQALLLAISTPGDQCVWALHVPTSIRRIRVNPELFASLPTSGTQLPICAALHKPDSISICGSVDIFNEDGQQTLLQAEELTMKPFSPATLEDDRSLFTYMKWDCATPNSNLIVGDDRPSADEVELATLCERLSYYYLRKWKLEITDEEWANSQWNHQRLRNYMNHTLSVISSGRHPCVKKEWSNDTFDEIATLMSRHSETIDIKLMSAVGENLPAVVRGQTTMLEHMLKDNMLDEIYKKGLGFAKYNSFLAKTVQQIAHRYPHANILEIGAGTGGTTKTVLETIGGTFSSYTFTDISAGFFTNAAESFKAYSDKLTFKVFDAESAPASQGFKVHSYDIVIAANVLHATASLQKTLENTRRLLKPGGYLIMFEITNNGPLRFANTTGGLPGWWVSAGGDDGRQYAPTVTPGVWHTVLRKAGFSGVDAISPALHDVAWPFSIIATQTVDDRIDFLRRPLSPSPQSVHFDEVIILGTGSLETSRIAEEVADLLGPFCGKISFLDGLPTEADMLAPMNTLINLVDLDYPIFKDMTPERMQGLKRVFELSKNILWITRGAQADEPYHMASIGFGRALRHEIPYLSISHLDLADLEQNVSKVISECLLRQCALDEWESQGNISKDLLWSQEPELILDHGQLMVPRFVANSDQNARLNSLRRAITKTVSPSSSVVSVSQPADGLPFLQEEVLHGTLENNENLIRVSGSTLTALNVAPDAFLFVSIGVKEATTEPIVALSSTNSSRTVPFASMPVDFTKSQAPTLLAATAGELLAMSLISGMPSGSNVLVHEPGKDQFFAKALTRRAKAKGIHVTFSTAFADAESTTWIKLSAWTTKHVVRSMLPARLTHFLDLTADVESSDVSLSIAEALPLACRRIDAADIFRRRSRPPMIDEAKVLSLLEDAISSARTNVTKGIQEPVIRPGQIGDVSASKYPTTVIDWTLSETLEVQVKPLDAERLFSKNKTYLLVGLTGQIGQSICEWMARNGAGCICLTSRRPNVDVKWLESFEDTDATVKVFPMDITNKQDLKKVVDEIKATCPPIAGVANAAMVLHDILFSDMSLDMMEEVLRPKIDGTNNIAEVFHNDKLDFLIMFSSVSCVVGNPGQSNYAAACAYMGSLANQRRKRGLAASTFDIGRVVGIGYVERAGQVIKEQLVRYGYMPISESDFHQVFAETIRAGYPDLGGNPVITTGISAARDDEEFRVPWFDDPRFSHCIVKAKGVENAFSAKLRVILQISDQEIDHSAPVIDLGIDSLVAVEVRSWFVKELKVDMPVLKVLGGGSIFDLSQQALQKLPQKVLSNIGKESIKGAMKQLTTSEPKISISSAASTYTAHGSSSPDNETGADTSTQISSRTSSVGLADSAKPGIMPSAAAERPLTFLKSEQISFAQSRFWFLRLLLQDQTTFNISFYYKVTGNLRIGNLERAIHAVGSRHEALRTCFVADENEADLAYQKVMESSLLRLQQKKISRVEDVAVEYGKLKAHHFDIERGETMRVILLSLSPSSHYLLINYHHMLMDGVGFQVFLSDLEKAYKGQSLGPQPRQFPEFSNSQRKAFENSETNDALKFWRGIFPDMPPVLPLLPMARVSSRMPMSTFDVQQVQHRLEPALAARVKQMSKAQRSTPFHFYLAAFKAMLFRFTEVQDLTIGIADANRNHGDVMGTIGLFLNLLTLRFRPQSGQKFADAITEARNTTYAALANSSLPFDVLLKELNVPRSSSYSPFFQAFFDYRQGAQEKHAFGNCQFEVQEIHPGRTAYDITLDVTESPTGTIVLFRTQKSLYDQAATDLLLNTYIGMLEVLSSDASFLLKDIPLFTENQPAHALDLGRGPNLKSQWPETLPHRIDQIAKENMDQIAIVDGIGRVVTYTDLIRRIEAIGEALQDAGVGAGSPVLVFQQATSDWVCSMLAIMRVGGIYVPLDLRNPLPRLAAVAKDCQPHGILVDGSTLDDARQLNVPEAKVINVSRVDFTTSTRVPNRARADSPGAILYTSGSTGTPKGIIIKHSGLRNEIEGYTKMWKLGAERVLQQSAFTFNHASDQMYTGLVNGGMVYIVPWAKRGDPLEITKIIREHDITYTKATPSEYSLWLQYGRENLRQAFKWRFAFGGGESLTSIVTQDFKALDLPQLRFFNSYGPAEISISSTKMEVAYRDELPGGRIPCGYSLPNYVAYILDEQLKPVPAGMPGEIVIGGAGVSLGYLNNKELTDQHFVPDPYVTPEYIANGWTRMYRTGDIGHLQADGALVFHSRMTGDTQIKIRGLRIELSDIESNILSAANGTLREAVVTLREGDPDFLVAHVVFAAQHEVKDKESFLQYLLSNLPVPQYMIPVMAIPLDHLPLSNHSKVDRKAIEAMPLPQRANTAENDEELSETMTRLKQVWQDVLGNQELGFDMTPATSFFRVGGNSLLIVRLQSRIREVFNVVVRLIELLEANTLGAMSRKVEESFSVDVIDWDKETALPDLGSILGPADPRPIRLEQKTVLLTGATGFLAKWILPQLVASPNVSKIHCAAVRDKASEIPRKMAITSSKIVLHAGDLSQPRLGLSESAFAALMGEVDVILHMGAARSFWDNYHVLRASNVGATRELVKLAATRHVPIHYISSAGVFPQDKAVGSGDSDVGSAAAYIPPTDGSNGYVASRWASEQILERAAQTLGVPMTIHRFVPATAQQQPGEHGDDPTMKRAVLDEFVRFVDVSGLLPELDGWEGRIDMMPAEQAANGLYEAVVANQQANKTNGGPARFAHYECQISLGVAEMREYMEQQRGQQSHERMPGLRWVGRIKALGFGYLFASQEVSMQRSMGSEVGSKLESRR